MQYLAMYSVEFGVQRIFALVPGDAALSRLYADDPAWRHPSVYRHWIHVINVHNSRVRVRDRIKFWAVPL